MLDVVTFGSATRDIFARSQEFRIIDNPEFLTGRALAMEAGGKIYIEKLVFATGGGGTNCAATFAQQGLKTAYAGLVGDDEAGKNIIGELKQLGAATKFVKKSQKFKTSQSIVLSAPDKERSILVYEGACHQLGEDDIPWNKIKKTQWFYISGLSGEASKVFAPLVNFAAANKIKLAINPGHDQLTKDLEILKNLLGKIDILLVNQEEASLITGLDFQNEEAVFEKFDELVSGIAVMTKGKDGVAVSDGKNIYRAGIPESSYVDRTGSGDAFNSGFVSVIIRGGGVEEAIQFGTANATATIQQIGAKNWLLKKGEWGRWKKVQVEIRKSNLPKLDFGRFIERKK